MLSTLVWHPAYQSRYRYSVYNILILFASHFPQIISSARGRPCSTHAKANQQRREQPTAEIVSIQAAAGFASAACRTGRHIPPISGRSQVIPICSGRARGTSSARRPRRPARCNISTSAAVGRALSTRGGPCQPVASSAAAGRATMEPRGTSDARQTA